MTGIDCEATHYPRGGSPATSFGPDDVLITSDRFTRDAFERCDVDIVALADAVVVVRDERDLSVRRIRDLASLRGLPLHVMGEVPLAKLKPVKRDEQPELERRCRTEACTWRRIGHAEATESDR